jgi:hypothetical protein
MIRRLLLVSLLAVAATSSGCKVYCPESGIGVFCQETDANPLNDPPIIQAMLVNPTQAYQEGSGIVAVGTPVSLNFEGYDPDADDLLIEWDLDGDGRYDYTDPTGHAFHWTFPKVGAVRVTVRAQDYPQHIGAPGDVTMTRVIHVVDPAANRAPVAALAVNDDQPIAGQSIRLDASASTDPDASDTAATRRYEFTAEGGTVTGRRDQFATVRFDEPGTKTVAVTVSDFLGAQSTAVRTIHVLSAAEGNTPPDATFTVTPRSPRAHEWITVDASASHDAEGPIDKYEWAFDGTGWIDGGREPTYRYRFDAPGTRSISLRVTDSSGVQSYIYVVPVTVLASEGPTSPGDGRAHVSASRPGPRSLAFSARITGSGAARLAHGRMRVSVLSPAARRPSEAERALRTLLAAPWRSRVALRRTAARVIALARARRGRSAACLELRLDVRPGAHPTGRLAILGGTGPAGRLHGSGEFRFSIDGEGSATVIGRLRARTGARRSLPATCRGLG